MFQNMNWRAVWIAGLVGGSLFLLTSFLLTPLFLGVNGQVILRYFASLVMGDTILTGDVALSTYILGLVVHYVLSVLFALVIAFVVHRWGLLVGILGGAGLGLAFYGINLYAMTVLFPWFFAVNNVVLLASHVIFGAVVGGIYEMFDDYDLPVKVVER